MGRAGLIALVFLPRLLAGQGITTAAITGSVTREDGSAMAGAIVRVAHEGTGRRWEMETGSGGQFLFEAVTIGGPYRIEARAIGFAPGVKTGIVLALGQRLVADFALEPSPIELPALSVTATRDPALDPGRTGPAEVIAGPTIVRLPNPRRDFLDLTLASPQVAVSPSTFIAGSSGITIGGQNRRLNSFQIDGGLNQDLYRGALPGRETLPRPISLEAVQEIQVHPAPFDVRHGGFAGGLVNAVTKAGSNAFQGSLFAFLADRALVGKNAAGDRAGDFTTWQFGATLGGPLVRNRTHYFLSVDLQRRVVPDPGPLISDTAGGADTVLIGIRYASVIRFQEILRNTYGLDPGTLGPLEGREPAEDIFGKISLQLGTNNHLEASHHYSHGDVSGLVNRRYGLYALSSVAQRNSSTAQASRLIWTGQLGSLWSSELIVSHLRLRDRCHSSATFPRINALADKGSLGAGAGARCPTEAFDQDILEATENLTIGLGDHVMTVGARSQLLHFTDDVLVNSPGAWRFRDLDALEAGRAFSYQRALYASESAAGADFRVFHLGLYAQDRWTPTGNLALTAGLRLEVPILPDRIPTNEPLQAALGIDTSRLPSGQLLWSPRLGVSYNVRGEGHTFLRGGIGLFSGRPAYAWLGSAYHDDGHELSLTCGGPLLPPFDPVDQPRTCLGGGGAFPQLSYFAPGVRFPQNLKLAVGADHRLPGGLVGTADLLYTRAVKQLYLSDANMGPPVALALGEGGRPLYGTISGTGTATTTARRDTGFRAVIKVSNRSGDEAVSLAAQLRKRIGHGFEAGALYAYTRARDRMSLVALQARENLDFTPLDGTLDDRRLTPSAFEVPHRVHLNVVLALPHRTQLSVRYSGASGTAFTYTIDGDANADGLGGISPNDIVYVPRRAEPGGDISLVSADPQGILVPAPASEYARLEAFVQEEPCLRRQRGRILERNSCRNPWFGLLSASLSKAFTTMAGQSMELTVNLYNVLNLMDRDWGQRRVTLNNTESVTMLRLEGYDAIGGRGVYRLALPARNEIEDLSSRWQAEIGVSYRF